MKKTYKIKAKSKEDIQEQIKAAIKEHIKAYGVTMPFTATNFNYSNNKIDDWFRIKEKDGTVTKYDRTTKKMEVSS